MKKYDLMLGSVLLAFCMLYGYLASQMNVRISTYPMFVVTVLAILILVLLVRTCMKNTADENFKLFGKVQKKQFSIVLGLCFLYVLLIDMVGFYTTTVIYLGASLFGLKVKKSYILITTLGFSTFLYLVFDIMLKVPTPKGIIF